MNNRIKLGLVLAFGVVLTVLAANFTQDVANTTIRYRQGSKLTFDTSTIIEDEDGAWSYTAAQAFGGGTNGGYNANPQFSSITTTNLAGVSIFGGPIYMNGTGLTNTVLGTDSNGKILGTNISSFPLASDANFGGFQGTNVGGLSLSGTNGGGITLNPPTGSGAFGGITNINGNYYQSNVNGTVVFLGTNAPFKSPTNTPTDGYGLVAKGTSGDTAWAANSAPTLPAATNVGDLLVYDGANYVTKRAGFYSTELISTNTGPTNIFTFALSNNYSARISGTWIAAGSTNTWTASTTNSVWFRNNNGLITMSTGTNAIPQQTPTGDSANWVGYLATNGYSTNIEIRFAGAAAETVKVRWQGWISTITNVAQVGGGGGGSASLADGPTNEVASYPAFLWYRNNYSTNGGIPTLVDLTGNGHTATNTTVVTAATPQLITGNGPLGSNYIYFPSAAGSDAGAHLVTQFATNPQPVDIWMVYAITNTTDSARYLYSDGNNGSGANSVQTLNKYLRPYAGFLSGNSSLTPAVTNKYTISCFHFDSENSFMLTNGVSSGAQSPLSNGLTGFTLAGTLGNTPSPVMSFVEAVIYVTACPSTNATAKSNLCNYYGRTYGITNAFWP